MVTDESQNMCSVTAPPAEKEVSNIKVSKREGSRFFRQQQVMKETRSNAVFVAVQYSVQLSAAAAALVTYRTNTNTRRVSGQTAGAQAGH